MRYVHAALIGFAGAIVLGVTTGFVETVSSGAKDRVVVYSMGLATGLNCAAFFTLLLVPLAVFVSFIRRNRRGTGTPVR
jgi:hypothetical protein